MHCAILCLDLFVSQAGAVVAQRTFQGSKPDKDYAAIAPWPKSQREKTCPKLGSVCTS